MYPRKISKYPPPRNHAAAKADVEANMLTTSRTLPITTKPRARHPARATPVRIRRIETRRSGTAIGFRKARREFTPL
jgi:hypothetical protein